MVMQIKQVVVVVDNDGKVASCKNIRNSRLEYKTHTLFKIIMAKIIPFWGLHIPPGTVVSRARPGINQCL